MTEHVAVISVLNTARRVYGWAKRLVNDATPPSLPAVDYSGQAASDVIKSKVLAPEPGMIGRFGGVEMATLMYHYNIRQKSQFFLQKSLNYIAGNTRPFWWDENIQKKNALQCGLFPR